MTGDSQALHYITTHGCCCCAVVCFWSICVDLTSDLYDVVRALPEAAPDDIAGALVRRYSLDAGHRARLFRRVAAIQFTRAAKRREVRELLPVGTMDGNEALVAVQRLADWLEGKNTATVRPFQWLFFLSRYCCRRGLWHFHLWFSSFN